MRKELTVIFSFLLLSFVAFSQIPKSDFSHIQITIDSADFEKVIASSFIRDSLGTSWYDTMHKTPPEFSLYINGQENFLRFTRNKGLFGTQKGTAYLIFQTRWPGQGKQLEQSWKSITTDSLISYDFKGSHFTLTEIISKSHENIHKSKTNHLIPMLSSYSVETYKKWGLGDSSEVSMKQFLSEDTSEAKRLFNKILSVRLSITKSEFTTLASMLQVTGYKMKRNKFVKTGQPEILFAINKKENEFKIKELVLLLSRPTSSKKIAFGNLLLLTKNSKAKFLFE
jgi:hypothetical protein